MKYMLLIYTRDYRTEADAQRDSSGDIAGHIAMAREAVERGAYVTCDALAVSGAATTVRVRDGRTVTSDGPFAETKEVLGGFYILDCKDLEEAVAYAAKIPGATAGSVEVRPIVEIPGWDEAIGLLERTTR
jgi:hypothetical protein